MGYPDFMKCDLVGFRFLCYKFHPWITLALAPFHLLAAAGVDHTEVEVRWMKAMSKIGFAGVYGLLNDLLW